jgi:poly-gamma-glutamate capsule biosynthesis protein CapA/YwtB (metallophosphatase superfamily)
VRGRGSITVALAGDTMLGREVGRVLESSGPAAPFSPEVVAAVREADLVVLNLECCVSTRGARWPDPEKPFFFRAPPVAVEALTRLGVDCVTLANNHALDYGAVALVDTLEALQAAGIETVGAGREVTEARRPVVLEAKGFRLGVVGVTDHPSDYAADERTPGVAFAHLGPRLPAWLEESVAGLAADAVLVTPHWGPNMVDRPGPRIRAAAASLLRAGATVVAGHSAHVFHGIEGSVLYDLGDFVDDYATHPTLRNDRGLLFLLTLDAHGPLHLEALPLELDFCRTRLAHDEAAAWIRRRFADACGRLGTTVAEREGRLIVDWGDRTPEAARTARPRG